MTRLLSTLTIGESATVVNVDTTGEVGLRALEMGMTPGTKVTLVSIAPLGDPLVFELRGYRLSLRRSEAAGIEVEG